MPAQAFFSALNAGRKLNRERMSLFYYEMTKIAWVSQPNSASPEKYFNELIQGHLKVVAPKQTQDRFYYSWDDPKTAERLAEFFGQKLR